MAGQEGLHDGQIGEGFGEVIKLRIEGCPFEVQGGFARLVGDGPGEDHDGFMHVPMPMHGGRARQSQDSREHRNRWGKTAPHWIESYAVRPHPVEWGRALAGADDIHRRILRSVSFHPALRPEGQGSRGRILPVGPFPGASLRWTGRPATSAGLSVGESRFIS